MKTAVTVTKVIQTGIDTYKDLKVTKVFDDNITLLQIKLWAKITMEDKGSAKHISLGSLEFSDVED